MVNRLGGVSVESLDPNVKLASVDEVAAWLERDLGFTTGLRSGIVWRIQRQNVSRQNVNQPFDRFSVAVPLRDPGADGAIGTADDGPASRV